MRSLADRYGRALTSGLTVEDVQAWPDILQDVTPEEIVAAAREVLDRDRAVTGFLTAPDIAPDDPVEAEPTPASAPAPATDPATQEVTQ